MTKVMIVDDSKLVRIMVRRLLERQGFEVICEASSGLEALSLVEQCNPDIIILDINMPDMDGLKFLEEFRRRRKNSKVIMLTAMDQPWAIEKARELGVVAFIPKPLKPEKLIEVLNNVRQMQS